jgi:uncharacterized repeat protein (TIGR01451 family)
VTEHTTGRWRGISGAAFAAGALGVLFEAPAMLLVGAIGVAYAAYASPTVAPDPELRVRRRVDADDPDPGEEVEVTVEVENAGETTVPDLRLVDGVPDVLTVTEGSPRVGTTLRPGATATVSYAVAADRGHHEFDPATAAVRNWSGTAEREQSVAAETASSLTCVPELREIEAFPLRGHAAQYAGNVDTPIGGEGIEFFATREYRRGDPPTRIDWNRKARTGQLSTVEFREERSATVILVVDAREEAYVADPDGVAAVEHGVTAARQVGATLLEAGNPVGVAAFGPEFSWLSPSVGRVHRTNLREHLALADGLAPTPREGSFVSLFAIRNLERHMPRETQVIFFSSATDDDLPDIMRQFEARGHAVTLVSPDPTDDSTPGSKIAAMERADRLRRVREVGIPVVDWDTEEPLQAAVERSRQGWS